MELPSRVPCRVGLRGSGPIPACTRVAAIALVALLAAACSTTVERVSSDEELRSLAILKDRAPTRSEVEGRLGAPLTTFEDGRVVVYALRKVGKQFETTSTGKPQWHGGYRLVLVYRADGTVERWSLVDKDASR